MHFFPIQQCFDQEVNNLSLPIPTSFLVAGQHRHRRHGGRLEQQPVAERPPPRLAAGRLQAAAVAAVRAVLVPWTAGAELFSHGPLLLDVHESAREASLPRASHFCHAPRLRHD